MSMALLIVVSAIIAQPSLDQITEAIAKGVEIAEAKKSCVQATGYQADNRGNVAGISMGVLITTPLSRVAQAACTAREKYQAFGPDSVTEQILAHGEVHLMTLGIDYRPGRPASHVDAVVLMPADGTSADAAVRPSRTIPVGIRRGLSGQSLVAVFPADAFRDGLEIRVVYSSDAHTGCKECALGIPKDMR